MTDAQMRKNDRATRKARVAEAINLRLAGVPYSTIAERLGYSNASGAWKAVQRGLDSVIQEGATELRVLELGRLDADFLALERKARTGDTDAIRTRLRIMERRAKLTGLDRPARVDIHVQLVEEAIAMGLDPDEAVAAAQEILAGR